MKKVLLFLTLVIIVSFYACGPSNSLVGTWYHKHEIPHDVDKVAVIAIANKLENRKIVEDELTRHLREKGINAVGGIQFLPVNATAQNFTKELLEKFIEMEGADGILAVSLLRVDDSRRYVPGAVMYSPYNYGSFGNYYSTMSNFVYSPGYYTGSEKIFLEFNLYNFPEQKLLWSAQTESVSVTNVKKTAISLSEMIVHRLTSEGIIK